MVIETRNLLTTRNVKGSMYAKATADEKLIHCNNTKKRKSWGSLGYASTSTTKPNILGKNSCVWCTERNHQWGSLSKGKRICSNSRGHKIFLLYDNARPNFAATVLTYLEALNWKIRPYPAYSLSDDTIVGTRLSSTSHYINISKLGRILASFKKKNGL